MYSTRNLKLPLCQIHKLLAIINVAFYFFLFQFKLNWVEPSATYVSYNARKISLYTVSQLHFLMKSQ